MSLYNNMLLYVYNIMYLLAFSRADVDGGAPVYINMWRLASRAPGAAPVVMDTNLPVPLRNT